MTGEPEDLQNIAIFLNAYVSICWPPVLPHMCATYLLLLRRPFFAARDDPIKQATTVLILPSFPFSGVLPDPICPQPPGTAIRLTHTQ